MAQNPAILLLDEATSALDSLTESRIQVPSPVHVLLVHTQSCSSAWARIMSVREE